MFERHSSSEPERFYMKLTDYFETYCCATYFELSFSCRIHLSFVRLLQKYFTNRYA